MAVDPREAPTPETITLAGETLPALADGNYDAIVCGTGLKECILAGLLAVKGKKVLIVDRNDYYGGECASLTLSSLFQHFEKAEAPAGLLEGLGPDRQWNVDLIPKFLMANGKLVKMLVHTDVTRYLEFKQIDASFVFKAGSGCHKVPVTATEAMGTSLMGFFQKRKFRNFLQYVAQLDLDNPSTYQDLNPHKTAAAAVFDKFGLDSNSIDFTGHALALRTDERFLSEPFAPLAKSIQLYASSLERYGKSPYIYPVWGLGGLPESFSRLCAVHSGTFILNAKDTTVKFEDGKAVGVTAINPLNGRVEAARAPIIIGSASYFPAEKVRAVGRVVRATCILDHPIEMLGGATSAQVILPQNQVGRKNDVYVAAVSADHSVSPPGRTVAIVSTTVETATPEREVEAGLRILGGIAKQFTSVTDLVVPVADGTADNCYIVSSSDASSHFESTAEEVLQLYARINGEELNMDIPTEIPTM